MRVTIDSKGNENERTDTSKLVIVHEGETLQILSMLVVGSYACIGNHRAEPDWIYVIGKYDSGQCIEAKLLYGKGDKLENVVPISTNFIPIEYSDAVISMIETDRIRAFDYGMNLCMKLLPKVKAHKDAIRASITRM